MMNEYILRLFHISLTTSLMIGMLLLLVPWFRKRYKTKLRYYLWLAVAVRLLIPFQITLPKAPIQVVVPEVKVNVVEIGSDDLAYNATPVSEITHADPIEIQNTGLRQTKNQQKQALTPIQVISIIWFLGMVIYFLLYIIWYIQIRRKLYYSPRNEMQHKKDEQIFMIAEQLNMKRIPEIRVCETVPSPILAGLIQPVLYLPHDQYSEQEFGLILRHEMIHYKRGDLWYKLILLIARGIHWFNPLVHLMVKQAEKDIEISCDDFVIESLENDSRAAYGETVLHALPIQNRSRIPSAFTTSFNGTKSTMKQRIKNIFDQSHKKKGIFVFCIFIVFIGAIGGLVAYSSPEDSDSVHKYEIYEPFGITYDTKTDLLYYNDTLVRYFEDNSVFYTGDGKIEGEYVVHYPVNDTGEIDVYAYRDKDRNLSGVRIAREDEYMEKALTGHSMKEAIQPYMAFGLDVNCIGTMFYQGYPVRELIDSEHEKVITQSIGVSFPSNAIDVQAVYEDDQLIGLMQTSLHEFETRTEGRIFGVEGYWLDQQKFEAFADSLSNSMSVFNQDESAMSIFNQEDKNASYVSLDEVEVRTYENGAYYIHDIITNHTDLNIVAYEQGMLAFDKEGNPLKLKWDIFGDDDSAYLGIRINSYDRIIKSMATTEDVQGGLSLSGGNPYDPDPVPDVVKEIKYVLYAFKQITFSDGSTWVNPEYGDWLQQYEGEIVDIEVLEEYYPYVIQY